MPYSATIIAAAIVQKAIDEGKPITQMKLQKMVYFAHGYNLAVNNLELIMEEFQAWKFGPVVPVIYNDYKLYGNLPISDTDLVISFSKNQIENIDYDTKKSLNYTWLATGHLSATDLSSWTHKEGSPWKQVYNELDWGIPISNASIKIYFLDFLEK